MKNNGKKCHVLLTDLNEAKQRLMTAADCVSGLRRYRDTVNKLEQCNNMEGQIAEKAHAAEQHSRILIKTALDTLNDLMDSGKLQEVFASAGEKSNSEINYGEAFRGARKLFSENFKDQDFSFFSDIERVFEEYKIKIKCDKEGLVVNHTMPGGKTGTSRVDAISRPGDLGRISTQDFFSKFGPSIAIADPAFADEDCHHEKQKSATVEKDRHIELYRSLVGGFAMVRDDMARHARVAQYFGRPHVRGNPPAVLVVLAIVAAVLIIAGVTILIGCAEGAWTGSTCDWGTGLLFAGVAIGAGVLCGAGWAVCEITINGVVVATIGA